MIDLHGICFDKHPDCVRHWDLFRRDNLRDDPGMGRSLRPEGHPWVCFVLAEQYWRLSARDLPRTFVRQRTGHHQCKIHVRRYAGLASRIRSVSSGESLQ